MNFEIQIQPLHRPLLRVFDLFHFEWLQVAGGGSSRWSEYLFTFYGPTKIKSFVCISYTTSNFVTFWTGIHGISRDERVERIALWLEVELTIWLKPKRIPRRRQILMQTCIGGFKGVGVTVLWPHFYFSIIKSYKSKQRKKDYK